MRGNRWGLCGRAGGGGEGFLSAQVKRRGRGKCAFISATIFCFNFNMNGVSSFYNETERNAPESQFSGGYPNPSSLFWDERSTMQQPPNHGNSKGMGEKKIHRHREINAVSNRANPRNSYRNMQESSQQALSKPYQDFANRPLTKQVDQLLYELPQQNKFSINSLCQPPEFLKVFSDVRCMVGEKAVFDCVLLGSPRPRVCWLFNDEKMRLNDVFLEDTSDICRCTIKKVRPHHYGIYAVG